MKRIIIWAMAVAMLFATIVPVSAQENINLNLYDDYAIVIDQETGIVLGGKNATDMMYPASITKIVTVAVSLALIDDLDATTIITAQDLETIYENGASAAYFQEGETVSYRDLILGALIPSGADACRALAFNLFDSQEAMVAAMNDLVATLGLEGTHFTNTVGLHDEDHYTTAYDMAQLLRYATSLPGFNELFAINKATSTSGLHTWYKRVVYNAINSGLDVDNVLGAKSGYTSQAQSTLATLMQADGREVIVVVGHAEHAPEQFSTCMADTLALVDYVNENCREVEVVSAGQTVGMIPVIDGTADSIEALANSSLTLFLPSDYQTRLQLEYLPSAIEAPVTAQASAGTLAVSYDGVAMGSVPVSTAAAVTRDNIAYFIHNPINLLFPYVIAVILILIFAILMLLKRKLYLERQKQ